MNTFAILSRWTAAAAVVLAGIACSDDEVSSPGSVAGTYRGHTLASFAYVAAPVCCGDERLVATEQADGSVRIEFVSATWGSFLIPAATVVSQNGVRTLSGEGETLMGHADSAVRSYACTVSGTIRSIDDAEIAFAVPAVMGGLDIVFRTGSAPAVLLLPGTYTGHSAASFSYSTDPMYTDDESLTIAAADDGTLSLIFASSVWGTFEAPIAASCADDIYSIEGSGTVAMGMGSTSADYSFAVAGRVAAKKDDYEFSFSVPAVMGGLTVVLRPGKAPATAEESVL